MKKFTLKAIALATASICGSAAFAGSISSPATDADATAYAVEALLATTDITSPAIVYTMGVPRTSAQDFTVIVTPSAGATFTAASCTTATPVMAGTGVATVSLKRSSITECAWEVDVTTASIVGDTLTMTGLAFDSHTLNTSGNTASITIALKDLGETAFIDNTGTLTRRVAISGRALTLTAAADTETKADVNDELGPLFGFVTVGNDADAEATATFSVGNNSGATTFMLPDGVTPWDFGSNGTSISVTVAGNFQGLLANSFFVTASGPDPVATVIGGNATFTLLPTNFAGGTGNYGIDTTFTSARTASLGTSRVFGVSAVADVVTGSDFALAGNSGWWTWGANASQLMTPYFTTNSLFLSRFFFLNESASPVQYSADCYSETGNAITYGAGRTGTLSAAGQTAVDAMAICSFSGNTRGAIIFTINAPIEAIKGSYQAVDPVSLNNSVTPLTRRYGKTSPNGSANVE